VGRDIPTAHYGLGPDLGQGLSNGRGRKGDGAPFLGRTAGARQQGHRAEELPHVLLRDFAILKGGHFGLLLTGVDNLTIENLKIIPIATGHRHRLLQNVRVSNCRSNSHGRRMQKSSYVVMQGPPGMDYYQLLGPFRVYELGRWLETFKKFVPGVVDHPGRIKCGTESNGGFNQHHHQQLRIEGVGYRIGIGRGRCWRT